MKKTILLTILCLLGIVVRAQAVSNARFEQVGKTVKIYYDLSKEANIVIYLSTDGGKNYEQTPLNHLSGHAGKNVAEGKDRCAVWDVLADREKLKGDDIRFKVVATPTVSRTNETFTVGGVRFTMVYVEEGTFIMGCRDGGKCSSDEEPYHRVTLSDYWIGETEVTQALWVAVMGSNPVEIASARDNNKPVENVSWEDVQVFLSRLSQMTGRTFRLPTEAEWEYAAHGGKKSKGYTYSGSNNINEVAWYKGNSEGHIHVVKGKQPNELGIYEMSGNVMEWCQDWHDRYTLSPQTDPTGPPEATDGNYRVTRGGMFFSDGYQCYIVRRKAYRPDVRNTFIGFRIVMKQQ